MVGPPPLASGPFASEPLPPEPFPSEPFASGRDADVFALGGGRVLRRYRDGGDVAAEVAVMEHVRNYGFPVPRVFSAAGPDLVMERLTGPTAMAALAAGALALDDCVDLLAGLLGRLHAVPARLDTDPATTILHLDLHPENVVLTAAGPVVIDWRNATEGPADLDVAMSALILAEVAVGGADGPTAVAGAALPLFLARAAGDPGRLLTRAAALRAADPKLSAEEVARLDDATALVRRCLAAVDPRA